MGWGKAAAAQNQATQMAMMAQAQQAAQAQNALQQGQAQATAALGKGMEAYQPYQAAGVSATNQLAKLYGPGGEYTQMPTLAQLQMDPSYAFREQQGMKALNQSLAAKGMGLSGTMMKGAQQYGQGLASEEYGNAYNRFMANRAAAAQGLQGLYSGGLTAAGGMGNLAGGQANVYRGTAQDLAQNYQGLGQAIGQGYANMGANNASAYMAPTNFMASLAGQIPQMAAMYAGGGFGGAGAAAKAATPSFAGNYAGPSGYYNFGGQSVPYVRGT